MQAPLTVMYKHLFFDLDHTLWDFDRNSAESLTEIYHTYQLVNMGITSSELFSDHFIRINKQLWSDFDDNRISHAYIRQHRFPLVFESLGVNDTSCCVELNDAYLQLLPRKTHLTESAREILDHLQGRYELHIITNGFDEIQATKLASSEITHYFTHIITNEKASAKKPDPRIFQYALAISGASVADSIMIGDNYEADILGAKTIGLDTVFYNPKGDRVEEKPTYDIKHWKELMAIL